MFKLRPKLGWRQRKGQKVNIIHEFIDREMKSNTYTIFILETPYNAHVHLLKMLIEGQKRYPMTNQSMQV